MTKPGGQASSKWS